MAFTSEEVSYVTYICGQPTRTDYLARTAEQLAELAAYSTESENRIHELIRKIKRLEQRIEECQNTFGVMAQPGKQMSSGQMLGQYQAEAYRLTRNLAEDAQLSIYRNVFAHNSTGRLVRG